MGLFPEKMYEGQSWRRKHGEPKNRIQLFQCVLTDQFFSLIPVNLLYLLFWFPAMAWSVFCYTQVTVFQQAGDGVQIVATINTWMLGLIPCLTFVGPARAGMARLMRDWAKEEYSPVLATFFKGMRQNWKQTLPFAFLEGALPVAVWGAYQIAVAGGFTGVSAVVFWVICAVALLYLMAMQVFYTLLVTYDLKLKYHFRNAVLLLLLKLPRFLIIRALSWIFLLIFLALAVALPDAVYTNLLIPIVYYGSVGMAITELLYASYANKLCDDHLTKEEEEEAQ